VRSLQCRLTNARCQRISVDGVMNKLARRALDNNPANAEINARSAHDLRGRFT
jgi:hypothetical protein